MSKTKTKFCSVCGKDTVHNPMKLKPLQKEPDYRCTSCGFPKRFDKNYGLRVNGKIMFLPRAS